jgi:hypothetical protein
MRLEMWSPWISWGALDPVTSMLVRDKRATAGCVKRRQRWSNVTTRDTWGHEKLGETVGPFLEPWVEPSPGVTLIADVRPVLSCLLWVLNPGSCTYQGRVSTS